MNLEALEPRFLLAVAAYDSNESVHHTNELSGSVDAEEAVEISLSAAPANGHFSLDSDGNFTYKADPGFTGLDGFEFEATDGFDSASAFVEIEVTNDAPVADNSSVSVLQDVAFSSDVTGSDVNSDPLTFGVDAPPTHGTLVLNSSTGAYTYTPDPDYLGPDSFTFSVNDGVPYDNSIGTVTIDVEEAPTPNAAPTLAAISDPAAINEDSGQQSVNLTGITAGASESQALTITAVSDNPDLIPNPAVTYTSPNSTAQLRYTPVADAFGTAEITVTVADDGGTVNGGEDTVIRTFTVTVDPVNDAPSFTASNPEAVNEDNGAESIDNWAAFDPGPANESDQMPSYEVVNVSTPGLFAALPTVNANGGLTYTPADDAHGTSTFGVRVTDDGGTLNGGVETSGVLTFTITVNSVNDAPSFTAENPPAVNEDADPQSIPNWATFDPGPDNESAQTPTYTVANVSKPGLFSSLPAVDASGGLTYALAADANGTSTIEVTVQDSGGTEHGGEDTSEVQTITITIDPVNDKPSFTASDPVAVNEDADTQSIPNWATFDPGPDNESAQTATYTVTNVSNPGLFSIEPAVAHDGTLTYTPAADAHGTSSFVVSVQDSGGVENGGEDTSDSRTFNITVKSVNDAPSFAASDPPAIDEDDTAQTITHWASFNPGPANESDQTPTYMVSVFSNPGLFAVAPAVTADGTLSYTPAADAFGTASIDVYVIDSGGTENGGVDTSGVQTFNITFNPVNDKPSFTASDPPAVNEDADPQSIPNWATFDPGADNESNQTPTYSVSVLTNAGLFSVQPAVAANGTLSYTPAADQFGTATIEVLVKDDGETLNGGDDTSEPKTFTITVKSVNDAPSLTASNPPAVNEDAAPQSIPNWATFDPGPDNESDQTPTYSISIPTNAGLFLQSPAIDATGKLTYALAADAFGTAEATVTVKDSGGTENGGVDTSAPLTITFTVNPVNDEPSFFAGDPETVAVDAGLQTIDNWATFDPGPENESNQTATYSVTNLSNAALFQLPPAVGPDGTLTFTPAADTTGTSTFDVKVQDNGGTEYGGDDTSEVQTFTITVASAPDPPTGKIGNYVWKDTNKDGIQDEGESAFPGVVVNLFDDSSTTPVATTTSDNNGLYEFTGLAAGNYQVEVVAPTTDDYVFSQHDQGDDTVDSDINRDTGMSDLITLAANGTNHDVDAGLYVSDLAKIGDYVWEDTNEDGIQDEGESGLADATVNLLDDTGAVIATRITDADGLYSFIDLPAGTYQVHFIAPTDDDYAFSPQDEETDDTVDSDVDSVTGLSAPFTLGMHETKLDVDVGIYRTGSIGNYVWEDTNEDGIHNEGDTPLAEVAVFLLDDNGEAIDSAWSAENGAYAFTGLSAGTYQVRVQRPTDYAFSPQDQGGDEAADSDVDPVTGLTAPIVLAHNTDKIDVDAGLYRTDKGSIGDYVWEDTNGDGIQDDSEAGFAGLDVHLMDAFGTGIASTTTDTNGFYEFTDLSAATYRVSVTAPTYYVFSPQGQGDDDAADSDVAANGWTAQFNLPQNENYSVVDAGLYKPLQLSLAAQTINEGDTATLSGQYSEEPDTTYTVDIDWGDGTVDVDLEVSGGSFSFDHVYVDDDPTGTSSDDYEISVTLRDDNFGAATDATTIAVDNVAPALTDHLTVHWETNENGEAVIVIGVQGIDDPGENDTHTVTVDWADEVQTEVDAEADAIDITGPFEIRRTVHANFVDVLPATLTITDDDTGEATYTILEFNVQLNSNDSNDNDIEDRLESVLSEDDPEILPLDLGSMVTAEMSPEDGYFTLDFDTSKVSLWDSAAKNTRYLSGAFIGCLAEGNALYDGQDTVYVEGIHSGANAITMTYYPDAYASDPDENPPIYAGMAQVTVWDLDFDVDSDNDGTLERDDWEDYLEDSEYGIGKMLSVGDTQFTRMHLQLPTGLDVDDPTIAVNVDGTIRRVDEGGSLIPGSGWMTLWNTSKADPDRNPASVKDGGNKIGYMLRSGQFTLKELNYDPGTGGVTIWMEAHARAGHAPTKVMYESRGRPDDRYKVSVEMVEDEVKFLITPPDSFYPVLNASQTIRNAFASELVYGPDDGPLWALKKLSKDEITKFLDEAVEAEEITPHIKEKVLEVFFYVPDTVDHDSASVPDMEVALYHDHAAAIPDKYILAFAGTDGFRSMLDWINNFSQGLAEYAPQYNAAILTTARLAKVSALVGNLEVTGHSLGGGLASAGALAAGLTADTFNAAGLAKGTLKDPENGTEIVPGSLQNFDNRLALIDAYQVWWGPPKLDGTANTPDILSYLQNYLNVKNNGKEYIPNAAGASRSLEGLTEMSAEAVSFANDFHGKLATYVADLTDFENLGPILTAILTLDISFFPPDYEIVMRDEAAEALGLMSDAHMMDHVFYGLMHGTGDIPWNVYDNYEPGASDDQVHWLNFQ